MNWKNKLMNLTTQNSKDSEKLEKEKKVILNLK